MRQALEASRAQSDHPFGVAQGDARRVPFEDASADAVLLLGPLYHLTDRAARVQALREAGRVLKPTGLVLAAVISCFASLWDGLRHGFLDDPQFWEIVERDLQTGQHLNPSGNAAYFTNSRPRHLLSSIGPPPGSWTSSAWLAGASSAATSQRGTRVSRFLVEETNGQPP